jgi:hypothetical protein
MRFFILLIAVLLTRFGFSQAITTARYAVADSGKQEFKAQAKSDSADYSKAFRILSDQVRLDPKNAEYRYYLGYAMDRLNSNYGDGIFQLNRGMTIKASEQFEEVIRLERVYLGELFILDPYSKLGSIWGSLAGAYMNRGMIDSAKWAFSEGKRRGGFLEPLLEFNRQLLNSCERNAILVTYGDNVTFPTWYLQVTEGYRTDITIIDASLLHTIWYPKYLKAEKKLQLSYSDVTIDTLEYIHWQTHTVTAANGNNPGEVFQWEMRPTYLGNYVLKGDRLLLNIFQENFYKRPFYFTNNSDSTYNLSLSPYLSDEGLVNRVTPHVFDYEKDVVNISKNVFQYNIAGVDSAEISKSPDAITVLNGFRWAYFNNVNRLVTQGNYDKARELINLMRSRFDKKHLPFPSVDVENYFRIFFKQVDETYQ